MPVSIAEALAVPRVAEPALHVDDWPTYWFVRLEKAVEIGDHQAAADLQQHLARLGVHVRYGKPRKPRDPRKAVGRDA
jgi:hypothetical protein